MATAGIEVDAIRRTYRARTGIARKAARGCRGGVPPPDCRGRNRRV